MTAVAACALFTHSASAAITYTGASATDASAWTDAQNWSTATAPGSAIAGIHFTNGDATPALYTTTQGTTFVTGGFNVGRGAGKDGSLTITGGTLSINSNVIIGQKATGVLTIDGGAFVQTSGPSFRLGNAGGDGTVNLLSGTFETNRSDLQLNAGVFKIGDGIATFTGGTFSKVGAGTIDFVAGGTGSLTMSNGSDDIANLAYYEGLWDDGNLTVDGTKTGSFAENFSVSGATLTAVPKLSYAALLDLGGLTLILRRRK